MALCQAPYGTMPVRPGPTQALQDAVRGSAWPRLAACHRQATPTRMHEYFKHSRSRNWTFLATLRCTLSGGAGPSWPASACGCSVCRQGTAGGSVWRLQARERC